MTDNPRAKRLRDIASRMFPPQDERVAMTEEELAVTADQIVASLRSKRELHRDEDMILCDHGFHHHRGPHACDFGNHEECPFWAKHPPRSEQPG